MKNFVVKCPQDWATNVKWGEIIKVMHGFNDTIYDAYEGRVIGYYYTLKNGHFSVSNKNIFNLPELSIDQAHAVLCGIDWSCAGVEVLFEHPNEGMHVVKINGVHSKDLFSGKVVLSTNKNDGCEVGSFCEYWTKEKFTAYIPDSEATEIKAEFELKDYISKEVEKIKKEIGSTEIQYTIYQQLRVLGFKQENLNEKNAHGFENYVMRKEIGKKLAFVWDATIPEIDEIKLCLDGVILHTDTIEKVKQTLKNLGK